MGAIADGGGIEWGRHVTWIPKPLPIAICVGIAALGTAAGLDVANVEGFDMHLFSEPNAVGGGYQPEVPPQETEGYGGETIPGADVVFMGEPVSPPEQARIKEIIDKANLAPSGGEGFKVMLVPPEILGEVIRANDAFYAGVPLKDVLAQISPEARHYFGSMASVYDSGQNIIVTDRSVGFGLQLFPGERVNFFVNGKIN